jgi:hypothetical protein
MRTPPQGRPVAITGHISQPITITVRTDGRWRSVSHHCLHGWSVAIAAHFFVCPAAQSTGHIYPPLLVDRTGHGPHQIGLQHHLTCCLSRLPPVRDFDRASATWRTVAQLPAAVHAGACNSPRREGKGVVFRLLHQAGGNATLGRRRSCAQLSFAGSYDSFLPWLPYPRRGRRPVP